MPRREERWDVITTASCPLILSAHSDAAPPFSAIPGKQPLHATSPRKVPCAMAPIPEGDEIGPMALILKSFSTAFVSAAASDGSTSSYTPAPPRVSGNALLFEAMTGVPSAIDSMAVNPKPSRRDGITMHTAPRISSSNFSRLNVIQRDDVGQRLHSSR